jgi:hypothetical protein
MPSTQINSTGVTFPDATSQTTARTTSNTVTSNVAGTGISVSGATGAVTITNSGVTSAVAGNGVAVSAATGGVTFSASAPTFNSVGSYILAAIAGTNTIITAGTSVSAGSGINQMQAYSATMGARNVLSGTWRYMGPNTTNDPCQVFPCIAVRVS